MMFVFCQSVSSGNEEDDEEEEEYEEEARQKKTRRAEGKEKSERPGREAQHRRGRSVSSSRSRSSTNSEHSESRHSPRRAHSSLVSVSPYDILLPSPQKRKKEPVGEYTTPSEMIRIVSRLADEYWERGKIVISKHRFFETQSRERIFRYVMNACRRTPEGKPRGFESSEKKACLSIQSELNKYEQRDRERMC